jgi:hypothetical protein
VGFKSWATGELLTSADLNAYLMKQAVIVCTSGTRPASPPEGMTVYETDTDRYSTYIGSAWVTLGQTITSTYVPVLTAATTNPTLGTGSVASGRYTLFGGNWCTTRGTIQFGSSGAAAGSGQYFISLPFTANANITAGVSHLGCCVIRDNSAGDLRSATAYAAAGASTFSIVQTAVVASGSPWAWATADYISWDMTYEI